MQIQRDFYLQQLIDGKQNGLIKIITGIRRCGKSYLLFTLFYQYLKNIGVTEDHIIKIALDDIESADLRAPLALYKYIKAKMVDDDLYYILLDEIQLVARFEEVLNSLAHGQCGRLCNGKQLKISFKRYYYRVSRTW